MTYFHVIPPLEAGVGLLPSHNYFIVQKPKFCVSPVQFNTTVFSYCSFPVLGPGDTEMIGGGTAFKNM